MWDRGLLAIGCSHFRRNFGVLERTFSNLWVDLEIVSTGGVWSVVGVGEGEGGSGGGFVDRCRMRGSVRRGNDVACEWRRVYVGRT
jgi:hypothetical protein